MTRDNALHSGLHGDLLFTLRSSRQQIYFQVFCSDSDVVSTFQFLCLESVNHQPKNLRSAAQLWIEQTDEMISLLKSISDSGRLTIPRLS